MFPQYLSYPSPSWPEYKEVEINQIPASLRATPFGSPTWAAPWPAPCRRSAWPLAPSWRSAAPPRGCCRIPGSRRRTLALRASKGPRCALRTAHPRGLHSRSLLRTCPTRGLVPPPPRWHPPRRLPRPRALRPRMPQHRRLLRAQTRSAAAGVPHPPPFLTLAILGVQGMSRILGSTKVGGGSWVLCGRGAVLSAGAWAQQRGPPATSW